MDKNSAVAFATQCLKAWNEIHQHAKPGWLYRGQREPDWSLQTSLERYCERQQVPAGERLRVERFLIREFRRAYHDFGHHVPREVAHIEWLAVMQHHGAPTRALDFTYSVYVAAYFALEHATQDCAVWAIDAQWACKQSAEAMKIAGSADWEWLGVRWESDSDEERFDKVFRDDSAVRMACRLNPFYLNERLRAQRGAFLVPGDVSTSFVKNLEALNGADEETHVYRLLIPAPVRDEALRSLFHMNVTRASLFPGLDGYAKMLSVHHPTIVSPIAWKEGQV